MSAAGWASIVGALLIVAGYVRIDGARNDGLTGDDADEGSARHVRRLGNIGCALGSTGIVLVVGAIVVRVYLWIAQ